MLQVRENEISLHKWPGGATQLRSLEGTLLCTVGLETYVEAAGTVISPCGYRVRLLWSQSRLSHIIIFCSRNRSFTCDGHPA